MLQFSLWILVQLLCLIIRADANVKADDGPTESECRPYIEKALHELHPKSIDAANDSPENINLTDEITSENILDDARSNSEEGPVSNEPQVDISKEEDPETEEVESQLSIEEQEQTEVEITENESEKTVSSEKTASKESEMVGESAEATSAGEESAEKTDEGSLNDEDTSHAVNTEESAEPEENDVSGDQSSENNLEQQVPSQEESDDSTEDKENDNVSELKSSSDEIPDNESAEPKSQENASTEEDTPSASSENEDLDSDQPDIVDTNENGNATSAEDQDDASKSAEETTGEEKNSNEIQDETENASQSQQDEDDDTTDTQNDEPETEIPEDELLSSEVPDYELRDRSHISEILHLEDESKDKLINSVAEIILRDLRRIYENSIKPLESLYNYRDLSNRHFGDAEIFAKPLILFMGPWSAGKSTIINYLTGNENTEYSLRSGAEPSPAYFNIIMHGEQVEVLGGTQLIADWTFSGLQKFGQGLEERLYGLKLPNDLLKKVNIVEIPGILEVRKQVSRQFPFNDACQWFIDRADLIFLVYDPAKLDVGLETEAILDQLKGREYHTRIILNKADRVKPDELLRVQSALMWNISPLMSSTQPPVIYTVSLWSHVYEPGAPTRLLQAQEKALLKDVRSAIDKRIENKIASARRFAVRVRNHAKMVDCYLTTYYNHKSLFGNKKRIADQIIENPQNYHIYQGLSTLTNISRYDLPDPEIYREFFHLHALFEFKKLSETCTYFRGCPINKLDFAIAYDLPELVGKYKRDIGSVFAKNEIPGSS